MFAPAWYVESFPWAHTNWDYQWPYEVWGLN